MESRTDASALLAALRLTSDRVGRWIGLPQVGRTWSFLFRLVWALIHCGGGEEAERAAGHSLLQSTDGHGSSSAERRAQRPMPAAARLLLYNASSTLVQQGGRKRASHQTVLPKPLLRTSHGVKHGRCEKPRTVVPVISWFALRQASGILSRFYHGQVCRCCRGCVPAFVSP